MQLPVRISHHAWFRVTALVLASTVVVVAIRYIDLYWVQGALLLFALLLVDMSVRSSRLTQSETNLSLVSRTLAAALLSMGIALLMPNLFMGLLSRALILPGIILAALYVIEVNRVGVRVGQLALQTAISLVAASLIVYLSSLLVLSQI